MKFTIANFRKTYPNDSVCLDKIFNLRYGHLYYCPECGKPVNFRRISTRRSYQCRHCYFQLYLTVGTIFEKTTTPLSYWFICYLFVDSNKMNGSEVNIKQIELRDIFHNWNEWFQERIHVSEKYLKNYIDEASFRYINRKSLSPMFEVTLSHLMPIKQEQ